MGGINCGVSNGRVIKDDLYRLEYANYSKYLFKCFESFYRANAFVEDFTLLEISDTSSAFEAYKIALDTLKDAVNHLESAKLSLDNCYTEIEPLFRYSRLKKGSVDQYKKFEANFAKKLFENESLKTNETAVWESVVHSLQSGGEVEYLVYQKEKLNILADNLVKLIEEYKQLGKYVRQGVSHVIIRDIEVDITPLTAMILTNINELISSLTYLCLIEYSAHTSISGKKVELFDLLPKSKNVLMEHQKIN